MTGYLDITNINQPTQDLIMQGGLLPAVRMVNGLIPDLQGNVDTQFKVIEPIPPNVGYALLEEDGGYPEGASQFILEYDPADYEDYIADHPSFAIIPKGRILVRTHINRTNLLYWQEIDATENGVFMAQYARVGAGEGEWGELSAGNLGHVKSIDSLSVTADFDDYPEGISIFEENYNTNSTIGIAWFDEFVNLEMTETQRNSLNGVVTVTNFRNKKYSSQLITIVDMNLGTIGTFSRYFNVETGNVWVGGNDVNGLDGRVRSINNVKPDLQGNVNINTSVPDATDSTKGLVQVDGTTIVSFNGVITAVGGGTVKSVNEIEPDENGDITIPNATQTTKGLVQADGTTITVDSNGVLKVVNVDGLTIGISDINTALDGITGSIKSELESLEETILEVATGMVYIGSYGTLALLQAVPDVKNGSLAVVTNSNTDGSNDLYSYKESTSTWEKLGKFEFSENFIGLKDTPSSYENSNGKILKSNGTAITFGDINYSELTGTPEVSTADLTTALNELQDTITELINGNKDESSEEISEIKNDIADIQDAVTGINQSLSTVEGNVTTIQNTVEGIENEITDIKSSITTNVNNITTNQNNITTNANNITALQNDVTGINSTISTLETDVSGIQSDITTLETSVTELESNVDTINASLVTIENSISELSNRKYRIEKLQVVSALAEGEESITHTFTNNEKYEDYSWEVFDGGILLPTSKYSISFTATNFTFTWTAKQYDTEIIFKGLKVIQEV